MKKLFLSLLCIFTVFSVSAQTEETAVSADSLSAGKSEVVEVKEWQHLTFKGISIDGTPKKFGRQLRSIGLKYDRKAEGGTRWYKLNTFAGYDNCEVGVWSSNNLVYEVDVWFPMQESWEGLDYAYSSLKEMLEEKYGPPLSSNEEFVNTPSYYDMSNSSCKAMAVVQGYCDYCALFPFKEGYIMISITECMSICISYVNYDNIDIIESKAKEDL